MYTRVPTYRRLFLGLVFLTGLTAVEAVLAADRVAIHFADIGNIRDWHADNADSLYVQSMDRQWYRITFWSPCHQLPFAIGISFVTDEIGDLDKYSSILVNGERCWFRTFEKSEAPEAVDGQE